MDAEKPFDPYKPPFPASEAKTSEQRQEWLKWYDDSREHRDKRSNEFYNTAGICLLGGFFVCCVLPLLYIAVHEILKKF